MADDKLSFLNPEATGPDEYDGTWKHMIERFLPQFLEICHPKAFADIDWERGVEWLDKDLKKLLSKSEAADRWADKLLKVWRRSSPPKDSKDFTGAVPGIVYLHMEVQNQRDPDLPERVFVTGYRVYDRYRCPVVSLVILGQQGDWELEASFGWKLWGGWSGVGFPVVKLWEYTEPERWAKLEILAERNPFAVWIMAHLRTVETRNQASQRYTWKLRLIRRLLESNYGRDEVRALLHFVDWLMKLPEPLDERLDKEVEAMEAIEQTPHVNLWERRGIRKGREEGLEKGVRLGKAGTLKGQATHRFGELSEGVVDRLDRADVDTLDRWLHRLLDAKSLEDVFDDQDA